MYKEKIEELYPDDQPPQAYVYGLKEVGKTGITYKCFSTPEDLWIGLDQDDRLFLDLSSFDQ